MKTIVSRVVSRVLDPVVEIPVALVLAVWFAVSGGLRWRFLMVIIIVDAMMPFLFMMIALAKGHISNWDMRKRVERIPLYLFTLFMHGLGILLSAWMDKGDLARILLVFWIIAAVFVALTTFWKISIHAGANAVLLTFVNVIYGWQYWYLMLLVPLVAWARVYDKHHTWAQVAAGAILGAGITYFGMGWVGV